MIAISNCTCLCLCTVLKESQLPPPSLEASAASQAFDAHIYRWFHDNHLPVVQ